MYSRIIHGTGEPIVIADPTKSGGAVHGLRIIPRVFSRAELLAAYDGLAVRYTMQSQNVPSGEERVLDVRDTGWQVTCGGRHVLEGTVVGVPYLVIVAEDCRERASAHVPPVVESFPPKVTQEKGLGTDAPAPESGLAGADLLHAKGLRVTLLAENVGAELDAVGQLDAYRRLPDQPVWARVPELDLPIPAKGRAVGWSDLEVPVGLSRIAYRPKGCAFVSGGSELTVIYEVAS